MELTQNQLELRKLQKSIKRLDSTVGSGTSMISLLIPPGNGQLLRASKMLTQEYSVATNIKSRV